MAPCIDVLRQLSKNFNDILGADQGTRHAPANLTEDITTLIESLDENKVYRIEKGRVLDDDDEPIKDVIAFGLQNLVEGKKNPLSDYNEAFRNLQARRRMKPVTPGLAKRKLGTGTKETTKDSETQAIIDIQTQASQWQEGPSNLPARMEDSSTESEAEEMVDGNDGPEPTSIFYQPGAGEAESTFAIMGADDVALDMDTEVGYLTEDESNDGSEDDLDDSV